MENNMQEEKTNMESAETPAENPQETPVDTAAEEQAEENLFDKVQAELAEAKDKHLRLYSEFENYKRRTQKERLDLIKTAGVEMILSVLPVLDDFERALNAMKDTGEANPVKDGILLIYNKLKSTLESKGLKAMESAGQPFDVELHDAITNIPAPTEDLKGKVIDDVQKGYYLYDKVIRHAKVVVGQ